jgi:Asp-tRNA(Asn)/Glu-tRNA(Gln) amidotransferase B subunit
MTLPQLIAKFILNDLAGILKKKGLTIERCPINPQDLRYALELMQEGHLERKDVRLWCVEECEKHVQAVAMIVAMVKEKV